MQDTKRDFKETIDGDGREATAFRVKERSSQGGTWAYSSMLLLMELSSLIWGGKHPLSFCCSKSAVRMVSINTQFPVYSVRYSSFVTSYCCFYSCTSSLPTTMRAPCFARHFESLIDTLNCRRRCSSVQPQTWTHERHKCFIRLSISSR